jgi:hypothetical protein
MLRFFVGFCLVLERELLFLRWLRISKQRLAISEGNDTQQPVNLLNFIYFITAGR